MSVLKDKFNKDYSKLSRYSAFPFYYHSLDKKYVGGTTAYLNDNTVYTLYTVKRGDTFDSLALDFYNNPTYYWVICSFNHIQDPYTKLKEGDLIKIPSLSNIEFDVK